MGNQFGKHFQYYLMLALIHDLILIIQKTELREMQYPTMLEKLVVSLLQTCTGLCSTALSLF